MAIAAIIYAGISLVMSVVAFATYGIDKRQARAGGRRISEARLHVLALLGGWPGAWLGQQVFRHKTQKLAFRLIFWSIVLLHVTFVVAIVLITRG